MHLSVKSSFWSLLILSLLAIGFHSTPTSATRYQGQALLTLEQESTASIIQVNPLYQTDRRYVSEVFEADEPFELLGLNWEQALPEGTSATIEISFRSTEDEWTAWETMEQDNDHPDSEEGLWTYVMTDESEAFQYRVFLATENTSVTPKLSNVSFDTVDGGKNSLFNSLEKLVFKDDNEVVSREDWGADEEMLLTRYYDSDLSTTYDDGDYVETDSDLKITKTMTEDEDGNPYLWPQEYPKEIKKIIVHHTATTGNMDNPEESVRAIYYYHAVTRGWGDIGYNYIIAPDGTVYQGRAGDEGVVAGHASGYNTGTIGIALMGNYQEDQVPGEMMQALTALIYEKAELHDIDIDANGTYRSKTMPNLMGHRDVDSTTCPGDYAYDFLTDIREIVGAAQDEKNSTGSYAFEEVGDHELEVVDPGKKAGVTIKVKNTGSKTWDKNTYLSLTGDTNAEKVVTFSKDSSGHIATLKEGSVKPGGTGTFSFTVTATDEGGLAHFKAYPIFNGSQKSSQVINLGFYVEGEEKKSTTNEDSEDEESDDSIVIDAATDLTFDSGESKYLWVKVKNTTEQIWNKSGNKAFKLVITGDEEVTVGNPNISFSSLKIGSTSKIYFKVTAPTEAGEYTLYVRPRVGSSNLTTNAYKMTITVGETDFEETTYEDAVRIKLTPDEGVGTPILTSKTDFGVYEGDELLQVFTAKSRVRVTSTGTGFTVTSGSKKWSATSEVRFVPSQGGVLQVITMEQSNWNGTVTYNTFRGTIEVRNVNSQPILINELPLEDYLKGLGEETNTTPTEKLKTMAILGRSYAYYYMTQAEKFPGMPYNGEDDPATFQKYLGYTYEQSNPNIVKAVEDTKGIVVTYKGKVVKTPYFSQSDGVKTKSAKDVWGWTDTPWLVSVPDTYCKSTSFAGHGVGLSGCGAKALAEKGWTFEQIIKYYYTGVELTTL